VHLPGKIALPNFFLQIQAQTSPTSKKYHFFELLAPAICQHVCQSYGAESQD